MKRRPKLKESTGVSDWRHYAFFKRVVSPTSSQPTSNLSLQTTTTTTKSDAISKTSRPTSTSTTTTNAANNNSATNRVIDFALLGNKRSKEEIRELWRMAIHQQIILNRMDRQNYMLKAKQEEALGKRVKLSYTDLGACDEESNETWDIILTKYTNTKCDLQLLNSAILRGIPKHKRGSVWNFFTKQRKMHYPSESENQSPKQEKSYEQLRKQITTHQHAILIDLGRTFPNHPYFNQNLGSGQLALFNLLKAYSIIDTDVGYCQGLTFLAGMLLMHLEEEESFETLKYVMFDLTARIHYKSDMSGLQVKLYQLTRLIHDRDPELQSFLYEQDVLPSLYAAPWFLTMFASQFPIGFAVRVLDVVLLHGIDMLLLFACAIVVEHRNDILECIGVEQVMECFRNVVTKLRSDSDVDKYLRKVLDPESEQDKVALLTYGIEYSKMHNESFSEDADGDEDNKVDNNNKTADTKSSSTDDACYKLQLDIRMLLKYVENMQDNVKKKFGEDIDHPPEIQALKRLYFPTKDNNNMTAKKFGSNNNNNNNTKRLVSVAAPKCSIYQKENDQSSIDLPNLKSGNNSSSDDEN